MKWLELSVPLAALAAVVIIWVAPALSDRETSQLRACERGNVVRGQINYRGNVLSELLRTAATTRLAEAAKADREGDDELAKIQRKAAGRYIELDEGLKELPPVDCAKAVRDP